MENNIQCISINERSLPIVSYCDIITAPENFLHVDRRAEFNVMIYVTDGTMYVTEEGVDYEISAGELMFLKSGLRHFGRYETLRGTRWFYAHFYLPDDCENNENTLILPKKISVISGSRIQDMLQKLCDCFHSSVATERIRRNVILYEILLDVASCRQPEKSSICDEICAYLEAQTDKDFSKQLIERQFFMSYSHLAAMFKREKGASMGQYHNMARMNKACNLLRSTLMTCGEIADCLGFSDMLYFSKKFRSFSGVSPTEYRKQVQKRY